MKLGFILSLAALLVLVGCGSDQTTNNPPPAAAGKIPSAGIASPGQPGGAGKAMPKQGAASASFN